MASALSPSTFHPPTLPPWNAGHRLAFAPVRQVAGWGDILQLVVLELIRKVVRANPFEKSKYIRCILTLFNAQSNAVVCVSPGRVYSPSASSLTQLRSTGTSVLRHSSRSRLRPPRSAPLRPLTLSSSRHKVTTTSNSSCLKDCRHPCSRLRLTPCPAGSRLPCVARRSQQKGIPRVPPRRRSSRSNTRRSFRR